MAPRQRTLAKPPPDGVPSGPRIGLLAAQSVHNLGDTATLMVAVAEYRRRLRGVELVAVVPDPASSARVLGTAGFPLYGDGAFVPESAAGAPAASQPPRRRGRWAGVHRVWRFVAGLDAIVFSGGGLLDDFWGGPWELPFWVLVWVAAARLRGVKVMFHGVGVDRVSSAPSRFMFLYALACAHQRSVRDGGSREMLGRLGLKAPCEVVPDLAFATAPAAAPAPATSDQPSPREAPYAVVNPVTSRMWTHALGGAEASYLEPFVQLSLRLLDRGFSVKLASTQDKMDSPALAFVAERLQALGRSGFERLSIQQVEQFMPLAAQAQLVVSSRLHGIILALVAGAPVVAVSPMRKMSRVMHDAGLAEFDLPVAELSSERLSALAERALAHRPALRDAIAGTVAQFSTRARESFDVVCAAVAARTQAPKPRTHTRARDGS